MDATLPRNSQITSGEDQSPNRIPAPKLGTRSDQVELWIPISSSFKHLGKTPKHHLVDPALAARLLDVGEDGLTTDSDVLLLGPQKKALMGRLFESLIAQSLQTYAQVNRVQLRHFRSAQGDREVDFIIEKGRSIIAIETKYSATVSKADYKHLLWLEQQLSDYKVTKVIVNTGMIAYQHPSGALVIPAVLLGA